MMMFNMESVYTHGEEQRGGAVTEMVTSVRVKENVFLVSKTEALFLWSPLKPYWEKANGSLHQTIQSTNSNLFVLYSENL